MGLAGPIENVADDWGYLENNVTIDITTGIFFKQLVLDHNRTIVDLDQCATFTETISVAPQKPWVVGTQMRHHPEDNSVYFIDVIAATNGSLYFDAAKTLQHARPERWDPLPEAARSSREELKAAADAYLDMWSNETAVDAVPWGTPCNRLEGSRYTGNGTAADSCKVDIPRNHTQAPNSHRRYVIDPEMGSVSVLCVFEHLNNAPDSHLFRLENGKLRYVHTITDYKGT